MQPYRFTRLQTRRQRHNVTGIILALGSLMLAACASGPLPFRETDQHGDSLKVTQTECPVWKKVLGPARNHGANGTGIQYRCRFVEEVPEEVIVVVVETPDPPAEIVLDGVEFAFDSSALRANAQATLQTDLEALRDNPTGDIQIDGYTDSIGTAKYNMELSFQRAEAAKAFLVQKGIAADRIGISGHGKQDPVASNKTDEGRARNRRVTIRLD
jgi:outer membrane protein OmpA-like peptidoglycan-associated protein